jgi:hypothetical protein
MLYHKNPQYIQKISKSYEHYKVPYRAGVVQIDHELLVVEAVETDRIEESPVAVASSGVP